MTSVSFTSSFDYIVVGGGSAGSVVAGRLAETGRSVLLVEAGEPAENNPETLSADGFTHAFANDRVMLDRFSVKQSHCRQRKLYAGTGTGMGGSGAVNGMVYTRGDRHDFDQWPPGWQWDDIKPAFEAVEQALQVNQRAATRFTERLLDVAEDCGFAHKDGLNDGELCGFMGHNQMNYRGDERRSSYSSYLHNQPSSGALTIKTNCCVRRVLFDGAAQATATGVELERFGRVEHIAVNCEVVLCAGALETPKLLMLSGVGPRPHLEEMGIPVVADIPSIGENLQDHPNVSLFYRGKQPVDFGYPQVYGFARSNPDSDLPSQQPDTCFTFLAAPTTLRQSMYRMIPALLLPEKLFFKKVFRNTLRKLIDVAFMLPFTQQFIDRIYGIVVILGKPLSRGCVRLASTDVHVPARIDPAYYRHPEDLETLVKGVELAKKMAASHQLKSWGNIALSAGGRCDDRKKLVRWIHRASMTTFHFCGTCAMGLEEGKPVSTDLRLKGFTNVRVADASVMPHIPVAAINAPSMMVGYRAVDFIIQQQAASAA